MEAGGKEWSAKFSAYLSRSKTRGGHAPGLPFHRAVLAKKGGGILQEGDEFAPGMRCANTEAAASPAAPPERSTAD